MNLQVCQKDCAPTVITINHREIIKEWAGAVRLTEVHGWKGPLHVLGGAEAPLRAPHCVCFNLLVSGLNDSSALRWLYIKTLSYEMCFLISCLWLFTFLLLLRSPWFSFFLVVENSASTMPGWFFGVFSGGIKITQTFISLWYARTP